VFQNVFESIDPKTGAPTYRGDILEQQTGQWVSRARAPRAATTGRR
jgi:hypothetical protein